jgi:hypothetical protein
MKRDIFRRGVRMQIPFGSLEKVNDPLRIGSFDPHWPKRVDRLSEGGRPQEIQRFGEYSYRPHSSPVSKPRGGHASTQGPAPDFAQMCAMPIPVGTRRRKEHK